MKGQAMIIDALLFLMLCGMSAAILAWASSVYGNQALDAYNFLYLIDTESGVIQTLGEASYNVSGNQFYLIDQIGRYLDGQFNETDPRFAYMVGNWSKICNVSGMPMVVYIAPETYKGNTSVCYNGVCADGEHPLILTCRIGEGESTSSALESVLNYQCNGTAWKTSYIDLGDKAGNRYAHYVFLQVSGLPDNCNTPEPTYYSSPSFTKMFHDRIANIYTKIYY